MGHFLLLHIATLDCAHLHAPASISWSVNLKSYKELHFKSKQIIFHYENKPFCVTSFNMRAYDLIVLQ